MLCFKSNPSFLLLVLSLFLFLSAAFFSFSHGASLEHASSPEFVDEREIAEMVESNARRFMAETSNNTDYLILAAHRTHRRDPSDGLKYYTGGWNITNSHYLFSVAYSATPPFVIAGLWFVIFGLCLCSICLRHMCCFCCIGEPHGLSKVAYALCVGFLILFTCAAIAGTAVLYAGQDKFEGSMVNVLSYILHQADTIVVNLRDLLSNLLAAGKIGIGEISLPADVQAEIDHIGVTINNIADDFRNVTGMRSKDIHHFLNPMRHILIGVAAVMLILALLGFLFSFLGMKCAVYFIVVIGWILVAVTFNMAGMFLFTHNVVADSCVAMDEWLQHPTANSALERIIPKVKNETAQEILSVTNNVTLGLVTVVNFVITNVSNANNFTTDMGPLYYNQSGPLMPLLCNPYDSNQTDQHCAAGEVDFKNASEVWRNYICQVSASGNCTTRGRLTPERYTQMTALVNVSYGLYGSGPFLINLMDSTFLKETFSVINKDDCPGLSQYSRLTYAGFLMSSIAVMLSLILWIIFAREQRRRMLSKLMAMHGGGGQFGGGFKAS